MKKMNEIGGKKKKCKKCTDFIYFFLIEPPHDMQQFLSLQYQELRATIKKNMNDAWDTSSNIMKP